MPRPKFPERDKSEWNTPAARNNASTRIGDWATQDGLVTRLDAITEFANLWHDLINDQDRPISHKTLAYVMYSTILGQE